MIAENSQDAYSPNLRFVNVMYYTRILILRSANVFRPKSTHTKFVPIQRVFPCITCLVGVFLGRLQHASVYLYLNVWVDFVMIYMQIL